MGGAVAQVSSKEHLFVLMGANPRTGKRGANPRTGKRGEGGSANKDSKVLWACGRDDFNNNGEMILLLGTWS